MMRDFYKMQLIHSAGGFIARVYIGRRMLMREDSWFLVYFTALLNEVSNYPGCWIQKSVAQAKPSRTPNKENNHRCRRCARQKLEGRRNAEKVQ